MGQNIRTLPAHAQLLTQCCGYIHGVNQITVSSHILCHAWMFPLLTPVFPHQLLRAHNSSCLGSPPLLQSVRSSTAVWPRRTQENREVYVPQTKKKKRKKFICLSSFFLVSYLPDAPFNHPPTTIILYLRFGQAGVEIENTQLDRKGSFHSYTHTHTNMPWGTQMQIASHALLSISHTRPSNRPLGRCR